MRTLSRWFLLAFALGSTSQVSAAPSPASEAEDLAAPEETDHEVGSNEDADLASPAEDAPADEATPAVEDSADCDVEPVTLRRFGLNGDPVIVRLTDCAGHPNLDALPALRELVKPLALKAQADAKPGAAFAATDDADALLNPELLVRMQQLVDHFTTRSVEIVSGYRPTARAGSRHHSGDALDLRIDGIDNLALSEFARTLEATGVGYYPNSTFVHVDVREAPAYWVDRSRPGERAKYVSKAALAQAGAPAAADAAIAAKTAEVPAAKQANTADSAKTVPAEDRLRDTRMIDVPSKTADEAIAGEEPSRAAVDASAQREPEAEAPEDRDPRLDPDVRAVMDRALEVMNHELGIEAPAGDDASK